MHRKPKIENRNSIKERFIKKEKKPSTKVVATNRRALAKYHIMESLEAGMILTGPEVKSLRKGAANLTDGFVRVEQNGAYLWNVHISPYAYGSTHVEQVPTRTRKLLLNQKEIKRWMGKTTIKGLTVIPLEIYFNNKGKAKVKIALAKGKNAPDRRDDIKKKMVNREMRRAFADKHR